MPLDKCQKDVLEELRKERMAYWMDEADAAHASGDHSRRMLAVSRASRWEVLSTAELLTDHWTSTLAHASLTVAGIPHLPRKQEQQNAVTAH